MEEKELFHLIKELKRIEPERSWVFRTKGRVLGPEPDGSALGYMMDLFTFRLKPVIATPVMMMVIVGGLFFVSQASIPGDILYPIKRAAETTQVNLAPESARSKMNLELANRRLEDIKRIADENRVGNLGPALYEYQASAAEAVKSLVGALKAHQDQEIIKEVALEVRKLEENRKQVESMGVVVDENAELQSAYAQFVANWIQEREGSSLTDTEAQVLVKIKEDYAAGSYSDALEKILLLSNREQ